MVAAAAIAANKKRQAKAKAKRDALRKQLENDKREAEGFFNEISTDEGKTIPSDKLADLLQRAIGDDHGPAPRATPSRASSGRAR